MKDRKGRTSQSGHKHHASSDWSDRSTNNNFFIHTHTYITESPCASIAKTLIHKKTPSSLACKILDGVFSAAKTYGGCPILSSGAIVSNSESTSAGIARYLYEWCHSLTPEYFYKVET